MRLVKWILTKVTSWRRILFQQLIEAQLFKIYLVICVSRGLIIVSAENRHWTYRKPLDSIPGPKVLLLWISSCNIGREHIDSVQIGAFQALTPHKLVDIYQLCAVTYCVHLHGGLWRERQCVPPKTWQQITGEYDVTYQKKSIWTVSVVKTTNNYHTSREIK